MSFNKRLEDAFKQYANKSEIAKKAIEKSADLQIVESLKKSSKMGSDLTDKFGGFQNLTVTVPDVFSHIEESIPSNIVATDVAGVVKLTEEVGATSKKLIQDIDGATNTSLKAIVGNDALANSGLLNVNITAPFPDAVAASIKQAVPSASLNDLKSIAEQVVDVAKVEIPDAATNVILTPALNVTDPLTKLQTGLLTAIADVSSSIGLKSGLANLKASVSSLAQQVSSIKQIDFGFNSLIENAVEASFNPTKNAITNLASKNGVKLEVPDVDVKNIADQVSKKNFKAAIDIVKRYSDEADETISNTLRSIDNSASKAFKDNTASPALSTRASSGSNVVAAWNDDNPSDEYFNHSITPLQLKTELMSADRDVTEAIIFSLNSGEDVHVTALDIYYFSEPIIHYYLSSTGILQRIVPVSIEAATSTVLPNSHNERSIVIVIEGGIIGPQPDDVDNQPVNYGATYSSEQITALKRMLNTMYQVFPGLQVIGSDMIGSPRPGPHIDVEDFIDNHFNKSLLNIDWAEETPPTKDDINV